MHRLIFWGIIIIVLLVVGLIIDQIFYRIMRLMFDKHAANVIRLSVLIVVIVSMIITGLCGRYVTRLRVKVSHAELVSSRVPQAFDGFKIAHISDFHLDSFDKEKEFSFVEKIIDRILAEEPDVICFTGDLVTIRSAQAIPFRNVMSKLSSTGIPVFSVMGNHDYADYVWDFDDKRRQADRDSLRMIQREAGWQLLDNESRWLKRGNDSILIIGVENIGEPPFSVYGDLDKALHNIQPCGLSSAGEENKTDDCFAILLSHNPTHWRNEVLPNTNIDLTLSGHTHAMQFRIGSWSPSKWKYPEFSGLYQEGNQYLNVNTGLGGVGPKIRIGVRPEISIITIHKK